jgi:hypothetical protein
LRQAGSGVIKPLPIRAQYPHRFLKYREYGVFHARSIFEYKENKSMPPQKTKDAEISVYVTAAERNQLCRFAELQQKSLSKYMLDAGLEAGETSRSRAPASMPDSDLNEIKKQLFVLCRLVLYVGSSEQLHSNEEMIRFFQDTEKRAGQLFGGEGE